MHGRDLASVWLYSGSYTAHVDVLGTLVCNSLPHHRHDPAADYEQFRRDLKTYLFAGH